MICSRCKNEESICQSCAMPLKNKSDFGSNSDGSESSDYCHFCFANGKFTDPNLTKEDMSQKVETIMKKMGMGPEKIKEVKNLLPKLKRWK
jgi:hypothetical protein